MREIQGDERGFCSELRIREDRSCGLRIALDRSLALFCSSTRCQESYIDIEFGVCGVIAKSFSFASDMAHRSICKAPSYCTAHDTYALDMLHQLREGSE